MSGASRAGHTDKWDSGMPHNQTEFRTASAWDVTNPEEAADVTLKVYGVDAAAEIVVLARQSFANGREADYHFWTATLLRVLAIDPWHQSYMLH